MRSFMIALLALFQLISCSSDDAITLAIAGCDVGKPLEEIDWLKAEINRRGQNPTEEMKYCYIVQGTLDGNTVFIYEDCNPLIDKITLIYDCEGAAIDSDGLVSPNIVENKKVIWRTADFACTINL